MTGPTRRAFGYETQSGGPQINAISRTLSFLEPLHPRRVRRERSATRQTMGWKKLQCGWVLLFTLLLSACGQEGNPPDGDTGADTDQTSPDTASDASDLGPDVSGPSDSGDDAQSDLIIRPDLPIEDAGSDSADLINDSPLRILAVNPEQGSISGGTEILIVGFGFSVSTEIVFGGALCLDIDLVDDTKIVCATPPNAPGVIDVKVLDGDWEAVLPAAYTYLAPVTLDDIVPNRGPTIGGMPATVHGSGFTESTQISIGGRVALGIEVIDASTIRLMTPPGDVGLSTAQASNENGLARVDGLFTYYDAVAVDVVLPGAGNHLGGELVTLLGSGLDASDISVTFGLLTAEIMENGTDHLIARTPPGPTNGWVDVSVISESSGISTVPNGFYFYEDSLGRALLAVAPTGGSVVGGTLIVLSGPDVGEASEVRFGGISADILEPGHSWLSVSLPPASGTGLVDVSASWDGDDESTLIDGFAYVQDLQVTSIMPDEGLAAGGDLVTVRGSGFESGAMVRIGSLLATDVFVENDGSLTAVTPPGVAGDADVTVTLTDNRSATLEGGFRYSAPLIVHGISPTHGSVAGGTWVLIRGSGFVEPVSVDFAEVPAASVEVLDSSTIAVYSPPYDLLYVNVTVTLADGTSAVSPDRFLYFDPLLVSGGTWGDPIDGAVNVSVLTSAGTPLEEAFVTLSVRPELAFSGITDLNGQVTISGPEVVGAQVVSATRPGFSSATIDVIDAENITLMLSCAPDGSCAQDSDCRDGFVCQLGTCLDPRCAGQGGGGQPAPFGVITGDLTGIIKLDDPGPDERLMGVVVTSMPSLFRRTSVIPGNSNVVENDGPYTLTSRVGEVAVIGICGIYNDATRVFSPRYMGISRGLYVSDQQTYTVDIDCDIRLDQVLTIKAVNSPLNPTGPNRFEHTPYLDLGSEGYFGGLVRLIGTDDTLSGTGFAPLEGPLSGVEYVVVGSATTDGGWPYSTSMATSINDPDATIVLPEFLPVAQLTTPDPGGLLIDRYLEWELATEARPDLWRLEISDFLNTTYWEAIVPGDRRHVNLPIWSDESEVGLFPSGSMILTIQAVRGWSFEYESFDFNEFLRTNWQAWSYASYLMVNPPPGEPDPF